ncbi:hypothetical protein ACIO93_42445 [Streptomyces sp. NPDC087903]|uniref:hypothetical protein n=1 Tax=Streptomyces sp. NPDC087903 TaxID=3365819 RepID=UPI003826ECEA
MTVPIDAGAGLIFLASCVVGYVVYRHTHKTSTATPPVGDIGVSFAAGSVTLVALAFLFGVTVPPADPGSGPPPGPGVTSSVPAVPSPVQKVGEDSGPDF